MERYTLKQRIKVLKLYYKYGQDLDITAEQVKSYFDEGTAPSRKEIANLYEFFEVTGHLTNPSQRRRIRPGRNIENIAAVARSVEANPNWSIPYRAHVMGLSQTLLHRILYKDLRLTVGDTRFYDISSEDSSDAGEPAPTIKEEDRKTIENVPTTEEKADTTNQKAGTNNQKVGTTNQKVGTTNQKAGTTNQKAVATNQKAGGTKRGAPDSTSYSKRQKI